jgi:hypothetical protein
MIIFTTNDVIRITSRALFLAYEASEVVGMGIYQARDNVTEGDLWSQCKSLNRDGSYRVYADYAYGRMMKTSFKITDTTITCSDSVSPDYQSWCYKYSSYTELIRAAVESLGMKPDSVSMSCSAQ